MLNQVQPNNWSCLPTAFSTVTGIPLSNLLDEIGHDGSEIVFPNSPDPLSRKAFHPQECLIAIYKIYLKNPELQKRYFSLISNELVCHNPDSDDLYIKEYPQELFNLFLQNHNGVIIGEIHGKMHAAAWDRVRQAALDPNGFIYPISKYTIHHLYYEII